MNANVNIRKSYCDEKVSSAMDFNMCLKQNGTLLTVAHLFANESSHTDIFVCILNS